LRIDLPLDPAATTGGAGQRGKNAQSARPIWTTPKLGAGMAPFAPLFSIPAGRPVVLAFSNASTTPYSAHVHGHAFRLLDALDDGWKPFWLDTLVVPPQKTERIAFVAETRGRYLIQSQALAAAGPELATAFDIA
jgi:FtsP/CotA-like multicopper oxidase with cupredoxin domain